MNVKKFKYLYKQMYTIQELEERITILENKLDLALNEINKLKNKNNKIQHIGDPFVFPPPFEFPDQYQSAFEKK